MSAPSLAAAVLLPDRLPSLVVLVGFWIPPAIAGWLLAESLRRGRGAAARVAAVGAFVLTYAAAWFLFNRWHMPPYIPGASTDPTIATPQAITNLAIVAFALVLPGSAIACVLAYRWRERTLRRDAR